MIGGVILPSPVGIGLTDLPNIGVASGPPDPPPGSGITDMVYHSQNIFGGYIKCNSEPILFPCVTEKRI